jgi:short-subunit dehydrogenase
MKPVTFLTGASSGIGRALAPLLASDGHAVALAARREAPLKELAKQIGDAGGAALPVTCDVGNRDAVLDAVKEVEAKLGPVVRLVANAGIGRHLPAKKLDGKWVERIVRTNLLGAAYCVEACLPGMLERGEGHLVAVSSLAAYRGLPANAAYCASKAGLSAFFESLRVELRPKGISVTIISPGFVKTPLTEANPAPMPFMVELDDAVAQMHRAISRKTASYAFPWQLALPMRTARFLPAGLYDRIAGGRSGKKKS